jgi:hypothetical protein
MVLPSTKNAASPLQFRYARRQPSNTSGGHVNLGEESSQDVRLTRYCAAHIGQKPFALPVLGSEGGV